MRSNICEDVEAGCFRDADVVLPLEVHVFESEGKYFAFDARSYVILRLDAPSAAVLSLMRHYDVTQICELLNGIIPTSVVESHYARFLDLTSSGALSLEAVQPPARPLFHRLVLMLAGGCNMGCSYCFERHAPIYQNLNRLTVQAADRILNWFFRHQQGPKAHIQLYGGEPLLNWPVLVHVVERIESWAHAQGKELTKYLITNGTLLTPERIAYLREHDVTVQVSVDGDAEIHDRFRVLKSGKGTMNRIAPNIKRLAEEGVDFNLRAVLTRAETDPEKVMAGLRALGGSEVSFEPVATDNRAAALSDADWEDFLGKHRKHVWQKFERWDLLPAEVQSTIINICDGKRVFYGCGAGLSEVTVAPDGNVYECQRIYRQPFGNVEEEERGPVELDSNFLTMVDEREPCRRCWARYLCGGGCMHQSHVGHQRDEPLPQYCRMKRDTVEASIAVISELRGRAAAHDGLESGPRRGVIEPLPELS